MKLQLKKDSTDKTVYVFIQDSSASDGSGLTGLAYNTASLVCYYVRPGAAAAALSLAIQTVTGAHSDGGFVEVDSTNMPGIYRLDLSDAILATGVDSVIIMLKGAANMVPVSLEIQLTNGEVGAGDVWDEVLTAATHNIASSAGRRLRDIASPVIITGTSPNTDGTTNTSNSIELDSNASSVDGAYDPSLILISAGTGAGQCRQVFEYDGTNKIVYVNRDWKVTPDDTSQYTIIASAGDTHINEGKAQAGGASTITLNSLASSVDDLYNGQMVFIVAGTGADQCRRISDYVGSTKVATVVNAWNTQPDATSIYAVLPFDLIGFSTFNSSTDTVTLSAATIDSILDEVLTDLSNTDVDLGASITLRKAVRAVFNRFFRKVTQTASLQTVYNDSDAAIADMAISDDSTTQTKATT